MKHFCCVILICLLGAPAQAIERAPEPASGFKSKHVLEASQHMVVSGNVLASKAGDEMIKKGGNAIDAAIATQMVLNLVEPQASGIGGGGFLLYYNARTDTVEAYDGRETAPATATANMFLGKNGQAPAYEDALKGGLSVGTPGLLRMLEQVHRAHGLLPWKDLFAPAITLSQNGFPLTPRLYTVIAATPYIIRSPEARELYFTRDGDIKSVGTLIQNPALAATLRRIANNGADVFYKGDIAHAIADTVLHNPFRAGRLTESDIEHYQAVVRKPVCETYRGYKICGMPPPSSGGLTVLQALKVLERFDLSSFKEPSTSIHVVMDALRLSFADRNAYIADCDFVPVPIAGMLAPDYIKTRSALLDPARAINPVTPGKLAWDKRCGTIAAANEHPSTTHMSVVDTNGNAVSMTSSIEYSFGSGLMTNGFFLNNELTDFSLQPSINGVAAANRIEPGKRPRSSMAPMLVFDKAGKLYLVIGSPGGSRIISYVLQTLVSVLDFGMSLNDAINQPHYATTGDTIELEKGTTLEQQRKALEKMGHNVITNELTSGLHGITLTGGKLLSGVDSRREGEAVGQ